MQAFLESFKTVDEVYQECKKRGIKGHMRCCTACIIVELLQSEYPEHFEGGFVIVDPDVNSSTGIIGVYKRFKQTIDLILPPVMNAFALAFDEGKYPDLVKESTNDR